MRSKHFLPSSDDQILERPLHVGCPNMGSRSAFLKRVDEILDSRWFSNNGPLVQEFERRIANFLQVKHCICVCNATVGLEIAARAAGVKGEVIVPSYTFVATAHALQWQEITPVFADVDPTTHNINPAFIERHITPRTSAIFATHLWGRACPVENLESIAKKHGLLLMFDAAHAFGCSYRGQWIGGFGLAEVFSFHATKFLNSFEGGAITTNEDDLAQKIRLMTNFGFSGYDNVVHLGTNGKMTEICAAMGLANLEAIDDLILTNRKNYECYRTSLARIPGLCLMEYPSDEKCNFQYIVVEVQDNAKATRDFLVELLHAHNILVRKYFWPCCHRMEPYRSLYPYSGNFLHCSEKLSERILVLPTGNSIGEKDILRTCNVLGSALS